MDEAIKKLLEEIGNRTQACDKPDFYIGSNDEGRAYDKGWEDGEIAMARKVLVWLEKGE